MWLFYMCDLHNGFPSIIYLAFAYSISVHPFQDIVAYSRNKFFATVAWQFLIIISSPKEKRKGGCSRRIVRFSAKSSYISLTSHRSCLIFCHYCRSTMIGSHKAFASAYTVRLISARITQKTLHVGVCCRRYFLAPNL